jgi:hypothetical protein
VTELDGDFVLAYKTWRVRFSLNEEKSEVTVKSLFSGYSAPDLADAADPYADKKIHQEFLRRF